jgi:ABC-2 type transport system permease protein
MNEKTSRYGDSLRIVSTIAVKDIMDALKNRAILFNVLTVFLLMLLYQWIPSLMYADSDLVVYDAGSSRLVTALENSSEYNLRRVDSVLEMQIEMATKPREELGLVIPPDFDQNLASAAAEAREAPSLNGYVLWSSRTSADDLRADFERQFSELVEQPVHINIEGTVYPRPDSMGPIRLVSATLVLTIILMGAFTVPHLMFEEKRTKTLDALLVSPATIGQVVTGKALAGMFYCLTAIGVAFAFNWAFVTNWGLAILAVFCGALLAVGFGLLLGTFLERREQMMIWTLVPSYFLLGPVFLSVVDPIVPQALRTAFSWIPTVALVLVFRDSFSEGATAVQILLHLGIVAVSAGAILAVVAWKVQRADR